MGVLFGAISEGIFAPCLSATPVFTKMQQTLFAMERSFLPISCLSFANIKGLCRCRDV